VKVYVQVVCIFASFSYKAYFCVLQYAPIGLKKMFILSSF